MSFTITCPICGPRNAYEFGFGGEDKGPRPDEEGLSPHAWCDYVHMTQSIAGASKEWWVHRNGCGVWFTIFRDTTTNLEVGSERTDQGSNRSPESNKASEKAS